MGSKPTSQSNSTQTFTPPPEVLANYQAVTGQAKDVAATPYQAYGGQLVAPINGQQNAGIGAINSASGLQDPYNQFAGGLAGASSQSINPQQFSGQALQQYENPYQNDVINSTMAQINQQNAQQAQGLQSNAISSGAFGGDRAGVAQAALAGQQDIAKNATLAGLNAQNFQNALGEFNTQQGLGLSAAQNTAARQLAASQQLGNLGNTAQTEALTEANAQTNAGTLQQQNQQQQNTAAYNQFLQQQAYPFQTTGWLANIVEGIGSQSGGTTSGQQTQQGGNGASSLFGGLLGLGSMFLNRGGRVNGNRPRKAVGGGLVPYVDAETPLGGGTFVPTPGLPIGHTMPQGMSGQGQTQPSTDQSMSQGFKNGKGLGSLGQGLFTSLNGQGQDYNSNNDISGDYSSDMFGPSSITGLFDGFSRGGLVRKRFADGSAVSPDDLWADADNPHGTGPAIQPNDVAAAVPLSAAANLPTPEAAMAARYAQQMPAPQQSGLTPEQKLAVAMGAPMPTSGESPHDAPSGLVTPDASATPAAGLAKLRTAMGGSEPATTDPNAVYGGLAASGDGVPLPPSRPAGLGLDPSTLDASNPGGLSPAPHSVATAPMRLAGATALNAPGDQGAIADNSGPSPSNPWAAPAYKGSAPKGPAPDPTNYPTTPQGQAAFIRDYSAYAGGRGVDPNFALSVAHAEGLNPAARGANLASTVDVDKNGNPFSFGAFQLNVRNGLGNLARAAGIDPADPAQANAANKFAMDYMATHDIRPWQGDQAVKAYQAGRGLTDAPAAQSIEAASPQPSGRGLAPSAASYTGQPLTESSPVASLDTGHGGGLGGAFGLHLSDAARQAMFAAGMGMMGGKSMNPFINIGEGGLAGLGAYNNARQLESNLGLNNVKALAGLTGIQGADIENKIKQKQLDYMMGTLNGHEASGNGKADAVASATSGNDVTAPTVTAPTVVGRGAVPNKVVVPADDPYQMMEEAKRVAAVPGMGEVARLKQETATKILNGQIPVRFKDGSNGPYPGVGEAQAAVAGQKAGAEEAVKSKYDMVEIQPIPGGPTYKVPKSQLLAGPGAGSPPGSAMDAAAAANPSITKQPGFYEDKQKAIAKDEDEMIQQFKTRQLSRQRLQALAGIMQTFQPGAFAQEKGDMIATLRSVGINVPSTATANPAAFQEFTKNATANVFNDVRSMGSKILVSEIAGLTKANANPELQPEAAAAIIGQGLGVLDYEDQHTKDYFDWKKTNPNTVNTADFELPWSQQHPVGKYVSQATKGIAYKGQDIPAPGQRTSGQTYMTPKGPMTWVGNGWRPAAAAQ